MYTQQEQAQQNEQMEHNFRKMNLFFIKSKHAFRQFKNHQYFEGAKKNILAFEPKSGKQFVASPTPFGISNAYDYICEQASKNYTRKYNTTHKKLRTTSERYDDAHRKTDHINRSKGRTHFTLPNLGQSKKQIVAKMFDSNAISCEPKLTATISKLKQEQVKYQQKKIKQFIVNLILVQNLQGRKFQSYELKFNIYSLILNTFLKTRVNYNELTQQEFNLVLEKILAIYQKPKQHMEYKNLVNLRSTKEIFDHYHQYGENSAEAQEIIRYFFVAKEQIYQYQLNRFKDQLKELIRFQFQGEVACDDLFLFDSLSGIEITNLHQLMNFCKNKIVCGVENTIFLSYQKKLQQLNSKQHLVNRINKWKSFVPDKTLKQTSYKPVPSEKYQTLYEQVRRKKGKIVRSISKQKSTKTWEFIRREELVHEQNMFQ